MIVVIVAVVTVVVIVPLLVKQLDTSTTDAIFSGQLFAILAMFFKVIRGQIQPLIQQYDVKLHQSFLKKIPHTGDTKSLDRC